MPNHTKKLGVRLLDFPPRRDVVFQHIGVVPAAEAVDGSIVEIVVEVGAAVVFNGVFYCGDSNDAD